MMAGSNLSTAVAFRATDANGDPVSGAELTLYDAGTTDVAQTFTDESLSTANVSPMVADSAGSFGAMYVASGTYKIDITTPVGVSLPGYPIDDIDPSAKQDADDGLTDIAGLAVTDGNIIVGDGMNWVAESGLTARTSLGSAGLADANTFTGNNLFNAPVTLTDISGSANAGPFLTLHRNSASPAAADLTGSVRLRARNSAGANLFYGDITGRIVDPTSGAESGEVIITNVQAGASVAAATIGAGVQVGSPTGGDKGAGSVNAGSLYLDGTGLTPVLNGRTWQDMTASRAANTTYTNNTTGVITVAISQDSNNTIDNFSVNGVVVVKINSDTASSSCVVIDIEPGETYEFSATSSYWAEKRP